MDKKLGDKYVIVLMTQEYRGKDVIIFSSK